MKKKGFLIGTTAALLLEVTVVLAFAAAEPDHAQNAVTVNEAVQSVQADWENMDSHIPVQGLKYVVLDRNGDMLFRTEQGLSESINAAVVHRDTILDICVGNAAVGKLIIRNEEAEALRADRLKGAAVFSVGILLQCCICAGYMIYLHRRVTGPFRRLQDFAERVAGGNLDIPLEMDRQNIFGVFTESFDMMRSELKKARIAEAEANAGKKELVAKLSHDIKTPVASIRAAAEVGLALSETQKQRESYQGIIGKADRINALVTNLFTATLEELSQLSVTAADMDSRELKGMLENADYLHRAAIPDFPGCLVCVDKLRLQQVFDNIFANSYKYANTEICISLERDAGFLYVFVEDKGGGVREEELPLLKEKYKRGSNTENIEGAGLGLYISDYFMKEMQGALTLGNGEQGLRVTIGIPLS
ncbi:MAG: HAMP domain-containing histidine kinase [Butyrivibrio sp.]|nr:HAMP domain-containing histidine kinase [Acetatifactor muris]MCM1561212.1 HAMP domain-containing histidine kinase [Butyrivibrio sp.]